MKTKNLKYNITISTAPTMPKLGKGTECVQLLLSQVSKDMHEPLSSDALSDTRSAGK